MGKFNGVYNLDARLKEIDSGYELVYNAKEKRFELFFNRGLNRTREMILGRKVDSSILEKVRATRRENIAKTLEKIEKNNQKIEQNAFFDVLDKTRIAAREAVYYADRRSCDLDEDMISKIING